MLFSTPEKCVFLCVYIRLKCKSWLLIISSKTYIYIFIYSSRIIRSIKLYRTLNAAQFVWTNRKLCWLNLDGKNIIRFSMKSADSLFKLIISMPNLMLLLIKWIIFDIWKLFTHKKYLSHGVSAWFILSLFELFENIISEK